MPVPQYSSNRQDACSTIQQSSNRQDACSTIQQQQARCLFHNTAATGKMPVPQLINYLVERASCPFDRLSAVSGC
ncbi:MAG: hypothetical protein JGK10_11055 [Microcoleus sp. PH2017_13_LAR_U_A]|uniref:hypothetical protein n=1 Tax=Microcoleus sp. PH2017_13_LAR_U_A TaxID=2798824 RepID=UPI001DD8BCC4|nr:hypothetical protein [Microcoleus sp. PH2017_13_LAR_U_A]MCC3472346.1 hypothetical protein [Microcoleus sp. PH2017_13_LAR_U_A]